MPNDSDPSHVSDVDILEPIESRCMISRSISSYRLLFTPITKYTAQNTTYQYASCLAKDTRSTIRLYAPFIGVPKTLRSVTPGNLDRMSVRLSACHFLSICPAVSWLLCSFDCHRKNNTNPASSLRCHYIRRHRAQC